MKNTKAILSLALASALFISAPMVGLADDEVENKGNGKGNIKQENVLEEKANKEAKEKAWKEAKKKLEEEKDVVEQQKDELELQKEELEKQCEEAEASGNLELAEQIKTQIQEVETERIELKNEMNNLKLQMKEVTRNRYSLEELEELQDISEELAEEDEEITVIPVENIVVKNKDIKFDTPPVIKQGRTLIPVRAITQGFGATLDWNQEEQKVTITKDGIEIVLHIDSNIAIVNGEEVEIDVPSALYSNRTYVPLRFISETLGLEIDYDDETDVIEIDEDELDEEDDLDEEDHLDEEDDLDEEDELDEEDDLVEDDTDNELTDDEE